MTPLQFEQRHAVEWAALAELLNALESRRQGLHPRSWFKRTTTEHAPLQAEHLAVLYRRVCEHLALARARAYPAPLVARLDDLAHRAHQAIYQQNELGWAKLKQLFAVTFPQRVRAHSRYVIVSAVLFVLPALILGWLTYERPSFALTVISAQQLAEFEAMYQAGEDARASIGRTRDAESDWTMFGFYIRNNIGVAFQCFASGLAAGIGSAFALVFNGLYMGVVAGYLTGRELGTSFWSFVVTHAAFELTAIILSGAAGLRIGHAWLVPGRRTRVQSLRLAAQEAIVLMYGVMAMLLIAAGLEAFWSSARWVPVSVKYTVAALCWMGVVAYFVRAGKPRKAMI